MNAVLDRKQPQMLRCFRRTPLGVWSCGFFSGIESSGDATIEGLTMCLFSWLAVLKLELRFQLPKTCHKIEFLGQPAVYFCCHEAENRLSSKDLVIGIQDKVNPVLYDQSIL